MPQLGDTPLSAYLDVRNRNQRAGALDTQNTLGQLGILQRIQAMQQQQKVQGILASDLSPDKKIEAVSAVNPQLAGVLSSLYQQQRESAVFSPENVSRFTTPGAPGQPAEELAPEVAGPPRPAIAATPPQVNLDALRQQAALTGPKGMEAYSVHMAAENARRDALAQTATLRREQLQQQLDLARERSEDRNLSRQDQNRARMDMIRLAASLRAPPQPRNLQLTTDAEGNQLIVNPDGTTTPLTGPSGQGGVRKPSSDRQEQKGAMADYAETLVSRLETLLETDPRSTTGMFSAPVRGVEAVTNALVPGAIGSQATIAKQTKEQLISVLGQIRGGGAGRLSNQDMRRVDTAIGQLNTGTAEGMAQGLKDARELINIMKGNAAPVVPAQGGMRASDQDLINKYLKPK